MIAGDLDGIVEDYTDDAIFENDVLLLEWTADSAATKADDGLDTFIFSDGLIRVQTVRYTLQHKG